MYQRLNNWIGFICALVVWASAVNGAEELPATLRFLSVAPQVVSPSVEVKGFAKVDLILGRTLGPIGLRHGDYHLIFEFEGRKIAKEVKLEEGRGVIYILAPKYQDDESSEVRILEYQALSRADHNEGGGIQKAMRFINLTAQDLEIITAEGARPVKMGKERVFETKKSQLPLSVDDEVLITVDLRDLSACSVVFYSTAGNKLSAVMLPEPAIGE